MNARYEEEKAQFKENIELMNKLDESFREIRSLINSHWSKYSGATGIGITHARMMSQLAEYGPMKASHIADRLYITCGAVTGLSDRLIELGLITREKDEFDRRVVLLKLTDKGAKHVQKTSRIRHDLMMHLFDDLSKEEMMSGLLLFEKLKQNMLNYNEQ